MAMISSASFLTTFVAQSAATNFTSYTNATNATSDALRVVCAWPVSGQYGPGSRVLYYCLVAACVLARKMEWLKNACLAAALLFPAVAAIHGIVLAAMHIDGAVDMDVFGAFQLCSIGILAAPVTVKLSRTYFYDPGRNTIFLWTGLVLAGLLSLTVEFYRSTSHKCFTDDSGKHVLQTASNFTYGDSCGLVCTVDDGPFSPLRNGSANNIYVIPSPDKFTFNTATLLAAACCIPAILSLVSMWNRIVEINWKKLRAVENQDEGIDRVIEGTNGATERRMMGVNSVIRKVLNGVEIPIFSAAVLAILIIGERNFFSPQVRYQTEPIAAIGQWAPIAGTVMAALGSLLLLTVNGDVVKKQKVQESGTHHCNCSHGHHGEGLLRQPTLQLPPSDDHLPSSRGADSNDSDVVKEPERVDAGNRKKVANMLTSIGNYFGTAAHDDVSEFKRGRAVDFPEIPGEEHRNPALAQIRESYNPRRDAEGNLTPSLRKQNSRGSFMTMGSGSGLGIEGVALEGSSTNTPSLEMQHLATVSTAESSGIKRPPKRRDTLEVPPAVHYSPSPGNHRPSSSVPSIVG
ncbi:uncharacterized protein BDZ99DRAFT_486380 [Mytilinidion resinicola]|uniref:Uncharacterized protein n=1 Tax=Mytilinidion resinicola TaxID=574789 RepID=A0A6A6YVI3_9PEZI|nr:uncharacterized protein BDZ99DRAFT_486380 [Mytilinidion resinicola]KAF2812966.1 hypothetical protein BDZ99DRAFT_486380 [Mytilinidion resinicola]